MGQLYELLQATKEIWTDPAELAKNEGVQEGVPAGGVLPDLASKGDGGR